MPIFRFPLHPRLALPESHQGDAVVPFAGDEDQVVLSGGVTPERAAECRSHRLCCAGAQAARTASAISRLGHGIIGAVGFFGFTRTTHSPLLKSFT